MRRNFLPLTIAVIVLILCVSMSGVYALWVYLSPPESVNSDVTSSLGNFRYGTLYITKATVVGGEYSGGTVQKSNDTVITADIALSSSQTSNVIAEVTFYNSTDVSYYYDKAETLSSSNDSITYAVSGISQKDEVPSKTYKTVYVTFARKNGAPISTVNLLSEINFLFVIDKSAIGDIVAQTAVDRFRDILNNVAFETSYQTLEDAMNARTGWNKASDVTYIGNVDGSNSGDSNTIGNLFGNEFMTMDLDGDGKKEPITMMIKRLDLDNNVYTGDEYTYTNRGRNYTVQGAEMTLYITSQDLSSVRNGAKIVVYAATFTKLPDATEWTELVGLTKGTATANNYNGYGSANSFNTDTWESDSGESMEELVSKAIG